MTFHLDILGERLIYYFFSVCINTTHRDYLGAASI